MKVVRTGLVYRGSKPVMWSPVERTSLAEAEVEYEDKTSTAIWVKFPVVWMPGKDVKDDIDAVASSPLSFVIWTTTPWTIPGNRAISYSPRISYGVYEITALEEGLAFEPWVTPGEKLALADNLAEATLKAAKAASWTRLRDINPEEYSCSHPLASFNEAYQFQVPLLAGDHVTDDAGTGFVHTAPGHGVDDYNVWLAHKFSLDGIPKTVDEDGKLIAPGFNGEEIITLEGKNQGKDGPANKAVIEALIAQGNLLARGLIKHSYPHSWRSKAPVIFRATPQWFVAMDKPFRDGKTLRELSRQSVDETAFYPAMGKNRIGGMIDDRPDWLVSRQRNWGVPLAMFVRNSDGVILQDDEVDARIVEAMRAGGADAWWTTDAQVFLGGTYKAEDYEKDEKVEDILDVWFDSGSTHAFVLGGPDAPTRKSFHWPADVYLEGSDQHRGWFQSSLLEGTATRGRAPFKAVVTHGFVVAEDGRKMSKSLNNGVEPMDVAKQFGIEILRVAIAGADYGDDLRMGKNIIDQGSETYRKLRNTLRYLLGSLNGFTEAERLPVSGDTPLLERWLLHRLREVDEAVRKGYEAYEFRTAPRRDRGILQCRSVGVLRRCAQGCALLRSAGLAAPACVPFGAGRRVPAADGMAGAADAVHDGRDLDHALPGWRLGASAPVPGNAGGVEDRRGRGRGRASAQGEGGGDRGAGSGAARKADRRFAGSGSPRLYRRSSSARASQDQRYGRALHHQRHHDRSRRRPGGGVQPARRSGRLGGSGTRAGTQMRALVENPARSRTRFALP